MIKTNCFDKFGNQISDGDILKVESKVQSQVREYNEELYFIQDKMVVRVSSFEENELQILN